jgi:hypothetical protein
MNTDSETGSPYLLPEVQCSSKCPNHPDFSKEQTPFPKFCDKCYKMINKLHKPKLETKSLPPDVIEKITRENEERRIQLELEIQTKGWDAVMEQELFFVPQGNRALNRPRCFECDARLSLFKVPCQICQRFVCDKHFGEHECNS